MKPNLTFVLLLALILGEECRHSSPSPEPPSMPSEQNANVTHSAAATEPATRLDPETLVCQAILKKIYQASGDVSHPLPTVFLSENTSCMAAFFPRKNAIEIERKTYNVCRSFGADSLNALAIILSHELSHAMDIEPSNHAFRSNFWAYSRQDGSSIEREKSADLKGAFMAHLAGYRILPIVPRLIQKLYAAYPKQRESTAYPSEANRRVTALEVQGLVDTLIQVFDAANYLFSIGQNDMAAICYDHLLQVYKNPEIWNNYGIACAVEALRLSGDDDFAYPFELDWQLRLSRPRGSLPTEQQLLLRQMLLQRSQLAFKEALRLAPDYFLAQANAWCVGVISGNVSDIHRDMTGFFQSRKMMQPELEWFNLIAALGAARTGDVAGAERLLKSLTGARTSEIALLARYNLDVLKNGSDHAALLSTHSTCIVDPDINGLPSSLTLRRMATAFEGIKLGKEAQLRLAWENKANGQIFKARIGSDRFCIIYIAHVPGRASWTASATKSGFKDRTRTYLSNCENQYLQISKNGKLVGHGVYYNYRAEPQ